MSEHRRQRRILAQCRHPRPRLRRRPAPRRVDHSHRHMLPLLNLARKVPRHCREIPRRLRRRCRPSFGVGIVQRIIDAFFFTINSRILRVVRMRQILRPRSPPGCIMNSIFDCPDATHTSPTRMSSSVTVCAAPRLHPARRRALHRQLKRPARFSRLQIKLHRPSGLPSLSASRRESCRHCLRPAAAMPHTCTGRSRSTPCGCSEPWAELPVQKGSQTGQGQAAKSIEYSSNPSRRKTLGFTPLRIPTQSRTITTLSEQLAFSSSVGIRIPRREGTQQIRQTWVQQNVELRLSHRLSVPGIPVAAVTVSGFDLAQNS